MDRATIVGGRRAGRAPVLIFPGALPITFDTPYLQLGPARRGACALTAAARPDGDGRGQSGRAARRSIPACRPDAVGAACPRRRGVDPRCPLPRTGRPGHAARHVGRESPGPPATSRCTTDQARRDRRRRQRPEPARLVSNSWTSTTQPFPMSGAVTAARSAATTYRGRPAAPELERPVVRRRSRQRWLAMLAAIWSPRHPRRPRRGRPTRPSTGSTAGTCRSCGSPARADGRDDRRDRHRGERRTARTDRPHPARHRLRRRRQRPDRPRGRTVSAMAPRWPRSWSARRACSASGHRAGREDPADRGAADRDDRRQRQRPSRRRDQVGRRPRRQGHQHVARVARACPTATPALPGRRAAGHLLRAAARARSCSRRRATAGPATTRSRSRASAWASSRSARSTQTGAVADFSSRHPYLTMTAPGVDIPSLGRVAGIGVLRRRHQPGHRDRVGRRRARLVEVPAS